MGGFRAARHRTQSYDLGNGQSITFDYTPDGQTDSVDFSATVPMDYVIIKAGSSYNIFHYAPAHHGRRTSLWFRQ
ncbi:MAG TPA: hypothetical protein VGE88_04755 [Lysobacter sp.]